MLDIDSDRQRISLGLKQTQEDPWQRVLNEYKQGDVVDGKVTKIVAFGAFVEIFPGVEGWSTSRSSRSTTWRTRARSSGPATSSR